MRILIVSTHYPPQPAIASHRVHAHAMAWAERGADVTVLTTRKQSDQRAAPTASPGVRVEEVAFPLSLPVRWARREAGERGLRSHAGDEPSPERRGLGRALVSLRERTGIYAGIRMPDASDAWVGPAVERGIELARERPFDVVFASSGPYTTLRVAHQLRMVGAARRFVAEFRDLWTANHSAQGLFPLSVRERSIEREILGAADRLVTVSEGLAAWLRGRSRAPVDVIYNGHAGRRPARGHRDAEGPVELAYTGAVYRRGHDLGPLMRSLSVLKMTDPALYRRVRLTCAGGSGDAFRRAAGPAGVTDRLDLLGVVPRERSLEIQDRAAAVVSLEWVGRADGVLTGKLFEYLAGARPILVVGPAREITSLVVRCGRGVHAGTDAGSVADTIKAVADGTLEASLRPNEGLIESLSRENQSGRLFEAIQELVTRGD
ncbi:MAG: glycosyltransferase [Phycisphaerales bacterium]